MQILIITLLIIFCRGKIYFEENFDFDWESRWIYSEAWAIDEWGKFELTLGDYYSDKQMSWGILTTQDMKYY